MALGKTCSASGCYIVVPLGVTRCAKHVLPKRGAEHRRNSRATVKNARVCWICNLPPTANDPLTADHIIPRALGGTNAPGNYAAAHLSCNSRRGAKL